MMNPRVSVVIPTYNRRLMLREAVASVLAQEEVALELIIVDDGSADGTWEELRSDESAHLRASAPCNCRVIIERIAHRGPAAARNRGACLASGEYLAFLDSDDLWARQKLGRQLAYMQSHREFPLCQTQEYWIRDGRRVNPGLRHIKRAGDIFEDSLRTCLISPSAVLMRVELFHEMGCFDETLKACEDYDLWLRILSRYRAGLLDEALVTRRAGHQDQLSAVVPALDRYRIRALLKLLAGGELTSDRRRAAAEVLAEKCAIYAKGLLRRERQAEFNFYSALEKRARTLIDGRAEVAGEVWRAMLQNQALDFETP